MKPTKSAQAGKKVNPSTTSSKKFKVFPTQNFIDEAVEISKKYHNIKKDFTELRKELQKDPRKGDDLGAGMYKVRMAITEKGDGKSGGARVIVFVKVEEQEVYVLSVFLKSQYETAITSALKDRIKNLMLDRP